jgi:asparagine synthetase B (glutamine-hydrolysing)
MCGIHASISTECFRTPSKDLHILLCNRGPDHTGSIQTEAKTDDGESSYFLSFTSTVLALRGGHVIPQPLVDAQTGSVLCWNGEAWGIGSEAITGNDGQFIFDALKKAASAQADPVGSGGSAAAVLKVINSIFGPFAFVFLDSIHKQLYFSRDRLGRRSLLYNKTPTSIEFSSASDPEQGDWKEVEADGVYVLSYSEKPPGEGLRVSDDMFVSSMMPIHRYRWLNNLDPSVSCNTNWSLFNLLQSNRANTPYSYHR